MLKSSLCDYSDAYLLVRRTTTITEVGVDVASRQADERKKVVILENFTPLIDCIIEINNTQVDNAKDLAVVMANV